MTRTGPAAFVYVISPQHPAGDNMVRRLGEIEAQVDAALEAGFTGIVGGQHFLTQPYQMLQNMLLLPYLAARLPPNVRIGPTILLLPLLNPVAVAEELATLDILTGGRSIAGFGIGYRDVEYVAFNVERKQRASRFRDALTVIKALWSGAEAPMTGHFPGLAGISASLLPVQRPHPPIWIAANSDAAVVRAAEMGDAWIVNNHAHLSTLERQVGLYESAVRQSGKRWPPRALPIVKELYVAESRERAVAIARPFLQAKFQSFRAWGQDRVLPTGDRFDLPFDELSRDRFVLGDPEDCIQQLTNLQQRLGVNVFLLRMGWAGMPNDPTIEAIKLLGRDVIPAFERLDW